MFHAPAELLDVLLVAHAEALLLVHHQKAQVLEAHVLRQQPVGADHQVAAAVGKLRQQPGGLPSGAEAAEHPDVHREAEKALQSRLVMLLGQHRGGHQDGGLLAVQHAFHHRPQGHLGLAVAHVPAEQPVHGHGGFHVRLDLRRTAELIVCLGIAEVLLKLPLPLAVRREGVAREPLALGVEGDELLGHVPGRALGALAGLGPLRSAHFGELHGPLLAAAGIFGHQIQLGGRHVQGVRPGVADLHIVLFKAVHLHLHDAGEAADAVVLVDHIVPHGQVRVALDALAVGRQLFPGPGLFAPGADQLGVGEHRQLDARVLHARGEGPHADADLAEVRQPLQLRVHQGGDVLLPEEVLQHLGPPLVSGQDHHPAALPAIELHVLGGGLGAARVGGQLLGRDAGEGPGRQGRAAHGEGVGHIEGEVPQAAQGGVPGRAEELRVQGHLAPLLKLPQVLLQLLLPFPGLFGAAGGLVHQHQGVLRQVVQGAGHGVDEGQVAVRVGQQHAAPEPVRVGAQGGRQAGRVLAAAFAGEALGIALDLPGQSLGSAQGQAGQGLRRRQDGAALNGLRAALGEHVEAAHGIQLVPPELHAHRLLVRGGEEVQDAAPAGELAGPLHLLTAAVATAQQGVLHVLYGVAAAGFQHEGGLFQSLWGHAALQQACRGDGEDLRLSPPQGVEGGQALLLSLAGGGLGGVEGEVPHAQADHRAVQHGLQVPGHVLRRGVVRAEDRQGKAGLQPQGRGQIGPVDRGKAGNERRKSSALQQGGEGGGFLVRQYLFDEKFHSE